MILQAFCCKFAKKTTSTARYAQELSSIPSKPTSIKLSTVINAASKTATTAREAPADNGTRKRIATGASSRAAQKMQMSALSIARTGAKSMDTAFVFVMPWPLPGKTLDKKSLNRLVKLELISGGTSNRHGSGWNGLQR